MFYRSLSPVEQAHVVEAFTFELGKCYEQAIKERELEVLANVDADLCAQVAAGLGLPAPSGNPVRRRRAVTGTLPGGHRTRAPSPVGPSAWSWTSGADLAGIAKLRTAAAKLGARSW